MNSYIYGKNQPFFLVNSYIYMEFIFDIDLMGRPELSYDYGLPKFEDSASAALNTKK